MTELIERYTDTHNVVQSLRQIVAEYGDTGPETTVRLQVVDARQAVIICDSYEDLKSRNLVEYMDHLYRFEIDGTRIELRFHEKVVDSELTFRPAGPNAIDARQATQPSELSSTIAESLRRVNDELDVYKWDFSEVSGASIAHGGHITDFEYKYEAFPDSL